MRGAGFTGLATQKLVPESLLARFLLAQAVVPPRCQAFLTSATTSGDLRASGVRTLAAGAEAKALGPSRSTASVAQGGVSPSH